MKRIDTATRAVNLFGAGKDGFKDGDLASGVAPTAFNALWANLVQEEICNVVEAAGIVLDGTVRTQLLQSLAFHAKGRLLGIRVITTTQVYTPTVGTAFVRVLVVGGGGGGGSGAGTAAGQCASGAGGGGGGWALKLINAAFAGVTVTIGAAGAGVAPTAAGGNGGTTSFGALLTATGGQGGTAGAALSNASTQPNGFGVGGIGSLGDENGQGAYGLYALYGPTPISGKGGASYFGDGAPGVTNYATGLTAVPFGAGGSGGNTTPGNAGGASSGAGRPGICIIEEFA